MSDQRKAPSAFAAKHDLRESRETRTALLHECSALAVLQDSRRRVRAGSLKAAKRLDAAIDAVIGLIAVTQATRIALQHMQGHESQIHTLTTELDRALHGMGVQP